MVTWVTRDICVSSRNVPMQENDTGLVSIDFAQSTLGYLAYRVNNLQKFSVFMSI